MGRATKYYCLALTSLLAVLLTAPARGGEILDRIVATVNGQVILQSDWQDAVQYEALISARALDQFSAAERRASLDRLIDQELLREQMGSSDRPHATETQIAQRLTEIRKLYPGTDSQEAWLHVLAGHGFTEDQLKQRTGLEIELLGLVDARLRPSVNIDTASIESYYNHELLPQLRQQGASEVPLAEVTPKIRELLTQEKVSELLVGWLQNLRADSEIHSDTSPAGSPDETR
jgi:peptidyl-prolyl cis-trans isomerase SurA